MVMSARSLALTTLAALLWLPTQAQQPSAPYRLRVEYMNAPLGVDVVAPRFSWVAPCTTVQPTTSTDECRGQRQVSFRINVMTARTATTPSRLVWDSGEVLSSKSQNVKYEGPPLTADMDFMWSVTVKVNDRSGGALPPTVSFANSTFSTGKCCYATMPIESSRAPFPPTFGSLQ